MSANGRVLGVDPGAARVGVSISDTGRSVATPLDTVPAGEDVGVRLAAIAKQQACDTVVIGLPRSLSGRDTLSTRQARDLAADLATRGLHVELWDERLSTVEAERVLLAAGRRRAQRRNERDRVAATIILQGWLDAHRST